MSRVPKRDECACCFPKEDSVAKPHKLVELSTTTMGWNKRKQRISVYACEFCDGPTGDYSHLPGVIELSRRKRR